MTVEKIKALLDACYQAKRARELAEEAEENEITLAEKPVKLALDDIMSGRIVVLPQQEEAPQAQPESGLQ